MVHRERSPLRHGQTGVDPQRFGHGKIAVNDGVAAEDDSADLRIVEGREQGLAIFCRVAPADLKRALFGSEQVLVLIIERPVCPAGSFVHIKIPFAKLDGGGKVCRLIDV